MIRGTMILGIIVPGTEWVGMVGTVAGIVRGDTHGGGTHMVLAGAGAATGATVTIITVAGLPEVTEVMVATMVARPTIVARAVVAT